MTCFHHHPVRIFAVPAGLSACLLFACALDYSAEVKGMPPPSTREAPFVAILHGVEISDPYQWLEDQNACETRDWIARENA
jgi:hypothetical protein